MQHTPLHRRIRSFVIVFALGLLSLFTTTAHAQGWKLLVSNLADDRIVRYKSENGLPIDHFVGTGQSPLDVTTNLALGLDTAVYAASFNTNQVLRYDGQTGEYLGPFTSGGVINRPRGLAFGPDGHLYVCSQDNHRIIRYDGSTGLFLSNLPLGNGLDLPRDIVFGPDGNLYVSNYGGDNVLRYDGTSGAFLGTLVAAGAGGLNGPTGLVFSPNGSELWVADEANDAVRRYSASTGAFIGTLVTPSLGGLDAPQDVVITPDNALLVSSYTNGQVIRYSLTGQYLGAFVPSGAGSNGGLATPTGLLVVPDPNPCPPNVAQTPGTRPVVNVEDLLAVIAGWGSCE